MANITRPAQRDDVLVIENCPCCDGDVLVSDCGYSTFNPGYAACARCHRKWNLGLVNDKWNAGEVWNKRAVEIKEKLRLITVIRRDVPVCSVDDFAKATRLLNEMIEEVVIAAAKRR